MIKKGVNSVHCCASVCSWAMLAAIMQNKIRTALSALVVGHSALDALHEIVCRPQLPVAYDHVPKDNLQLEFASGLVDVGATRSVGRAKEGDGCPEDVFYRLAGGTHFCANECVRVSRKPCMMHGVVTDDVAGGINLPCKCRFAERIITDEEKGGASPVKSENFKQVGRCGGVGAVIEGKSKLAWQRR